ncbi:DNA cytosine methyltransferase [Pseudescherichia sp.]|uniref:DNA cytosine methyltransferase n=1 Tax=Pseudescherichia sp. TaxID=2055881 RepID=UPI0028AD955E|nr:DNA cytosine methyltransferase [Pseudescherichia sp.]
MVNYLKFLVGAHNSMNVIDLFSGVGGLSLGASRAGFDVKAAVEIDSHAMASHALNFPKSVHIQEDISTLTAQSIREKIGSHVNIDGIIGGPPCQGFSYIGKGDPNDSRNELYTHFFRLVSEFKPSFFLAENVPGIMQEKFRPLREKALSLVSGEYNILSPIKVKASDYGAPTIRTRIFFIGIKKGMGNISEDAFRPVGVKPITVKEALLGLPNDVDCNISDEMVGWRKIEKNIIGDFYSHLWARIPYGVGNKEAIEKLTFGYVSGCQGTVHTDQVIKRYENLSFGQIDKISRSARLDPNGFCPTLRAGTGSDKGSYQALRPIHPYTNRVITPREAARMQGFPDWFQFHTTKWHSFRQIGNSVSPIVAEAMLLPLAKLFSDDSYNCTFENQGIAL